jgi:hypothetical protein
LLLQEQTKRVPMFRVEAGFSTDPSEFAASEAAARRQAFAKAKSEAAALAEDASRNKGSSKAAKQTSKGAQ